MQFSMLFKFLIYFLFCCHIQSRDDEKIRRLINYIWGKSSDNTVPVKATTPTCKCVEQNFCANNVGNEHGLNVIQIRQSDCPHYLEICCDPEFISETRLNVQPKEERKSCGLRNSRGVGFRIEGQTNEAEFGEFPWMVAIFSHVDNKNKKNKLEYHCGGALIHPEVVLTTAHCIKNKEILNIRAGEWDSNTEKENYRHQDIRVKSTVIHSEYDKGVLFNNIGLLFLNNPVILDPHINVICLPPQDIVVDDVDCFSSGWGKNVFGREEYFQSILKKLELPMIPRNKCQTDLRATRLGERFTLHKSFVCAGGEEGQDTCTGDGGSPLVCPIPNTENQYYQIGMVAWGIGCGGKNIPGVYVNVAMFRNWIDEQMSSRKYNISGYHYL